MGNPKKLDYDDLVDTDTDQETNNEESERKSKRRKQKILFGIRWIRNRWNRSEREKELFKMIETTKKGDADDLVDTDTDRETNTEEWEKICWIEERKKKI